MILATTYVEGHAVPFIIGIVSILPIYVSMVLFVLRQRRLAIAFAHLATVSFIVRAFGATFGIMEPIIEVVLLPDLLRTVSLLSVMGYAYLTGMAALILFHGAYIYRPSREVILSWSAKT